MIEQNPLDCSGPPLSTERLAVFETRLGATLPEDYRRFLLKSNGGTPAKAFFRLHVGPAPTWMAEKWRAKWDEWHEPWVVNFYSIGEELAEPDRDAEPDTLAFWRQISEELMLPTEALPIGCVVRDDLLLLYLDGPRRGQVHVYCNEYIDQRCELNPEMAEAAIRFAAPSFAEFFNSLHEEKE